jgi:hypothetical protein
VRCELGFPLAGDWTEVFNSDVYDNWVNPAAVGNGVASWRTVLDARLAGVGEDRHPGEFNSGVRALTAVKQRRLLL